LLLLPPPLLLLLLPPLLLPPLLLPPLPLAPLPTVVASPPAGADADAGAEDADEARLAADADSPCELSVALGVLDCGPSGTGPLATSFITRPTVLF
jgi:hypothetical protein